jgi:hypothetical protein
MEASKLKEILEQHRLWIETNKVQGKRAELSGANLSGANLTGAYLYGAYLYGADLKDANLTGANLTVANLTVANLSGANLTGAYFHGANLSYAYLCGAYLSGANLSDANLSDANLTGANLTGANLALADLSGAIGLPYVYWIIPGCLAQLNEIKHGFYLEKENKLDNFVQDSFGFFIQDNSEEKTFDMLLGDRIIRNIPHWVKYSGLKKIESV